MIRVYIEYAGKELFEVIKVFIAEVNSVEEYECLEYDWENISKECEPHENAEFLGMYYI